MVLEIRASEPQKTCMIIINKGKAKIDNKQQDIKIKLCGERGEMINYIMSNCIKEAQKDYKASHK